MSGRDRCIQETQHRQCLGPPMLLGTHRNVVSPFKMRRTKMKFQVEQSVLMYGINMFIFILI